MATTIRPTNEHIVEMLRRILQDLDEVKKTQEQLVADVRRAAPRGTGT